MQNRLLRSATVLLLFFSILFSHQQAQATHAVGFDLTYVCLGGNQYRFTLNFYRDCVGVSAPSSATIGINSASCGISTSTTLSLISVTEVSPLCVQQQGNSSCSGGSLPGIEQYIYEGDFTLPAQCNDWIISYQLCCRNNAITNLSSPGNQSIYAQALINNTAGICNNSPIFTSLPVPYYCSNIQYFYNHGAVDIDGDQLVYTLIDPLTGFNDPIPHSGSFSATDPMGTTGGFGFDAVTGQMSFTPNGGQQAVVTILVEEYRGGVLVGSTIRDMQVVVLDNCNNVPPTATGINGTTNFTVQVCAGFPLCFDINTGDPDPGQTVTASWNQGIPGGTFTQSGSPPSAQFCWTSTLNDIGLNTFTVTVSDDACPIPGNNVYVYTIDVVPNPNPPIDAGPDVGICEGESTQLTATSAVAGLVYEWSPPLGLSCTTCPNPVATPALTTTYSVSATYPDGCIGTDNVVVNIDPSPSVTVFPQSALVCAGSSIQLTGFSDPNSTFQWSTGQTDTNIIVTPTGNMDVVLTATNAFGCTTSDTAFIEYSPPPPPQVCNNVYVTTTGSGGGMSASDPTDLLSGIALAQCNNLTIKVATGTYVIDNPIAISSLLTIEGGFDPANSWYKTSQAGATTIRRSNLNPEGPPEAQRLVAMYANGSAFFRLQDLTIEVDNATATGQEGMSVYGLHLTACNNYDIVRCQIVAGNAGDGGTGAPGAQGANGQNGGNGSGQNGGAGAGGGGNGGDGGDDGGVFSNGDDGDNGTAASVGGASGGNGGDGGAGICIVNINSPNNGSVGGSGSASAVVGAAGGAGPAGSFGLGFYQPGAQAPAGGAGGTGNPGGGGGGGGGMGGLCDDDGNGGGGGGAGGTGGTGGDGGYGGGTSIGVYVYNNGANGNIINSNISAGTAGNGGAGGPGGGGGNGGNGGIGATSNDGGNGGDGGAGGAGGSGGAGGTGANGTSTALRSDGGTPLVTQDAAFNLTGQAVINVENISCSNTPVNYTSGAGAAWDYGSGANPQNGNGANVITEYLTVGRKDVTFGADNYAGFHRIAIDNSTYQPEIQTTANPLAVDQYYLCVGESADFTTTTPGIGYEWDFDGALAPTLRTDQNVLGEIFNTPGTYDITLRVNTDCCGWSQPDQIQLIVDPLPTFTVAGDTSICEGESTDITLSGSPTFEMYPTFGVLTGPTVTVNLAPLDTTSYLIYVESPNGFCTAQRALTILVNPAPEISVNPILPAACNNDGSATAVGMGGSGSFGYQWDDPANQNTATASNLFTGNYQVVVTDLVTGCVDSTYAFVPSNGAPIVFIDQVQHVSCYNGNDGEARVAVSGGIGPYTYSWDGGQNTALITGLTTGLYEVTVTDNNNCSGITSIFIAQPDSMFLTVVDTDSASCFTSADGSAEVVADGGSGGYLYTWSNSDTGPVADSLLPGTYTVTVTDVNNCQEILSIDIFAPSEIDLQTVDDTVSCFYSTDGIVNVLISNNTQPITGINWNNGVNTPVNPGLAPGTYYVTVTDATNCTFEDSATVRAPDSILIAETIVDLQCFQDGTGDISVVVTGGVPGIGTPYTYSWSNIATTAQISSLAAGSYTVTATDGIGCTASETYNVVEPAAVDLAEGSHDDISCFGLTDGSVTLLASGGTPTYQYSIDGGALQGSDVFGTLSAGTYFFEVVDINNCSDTVSVTIIEPDELEVTAITADPLCNDGDDGEIVAGAIGGTLPYEYDLDGGTTQTDVTFANLTSGNYDVGVTDANGCNASTSVVLNNPPPVTVDIQATELEVIFGDTTLLEAFPNPVPADLTTVTFAWAPDETLDCPDCPQTSAQPLTPTTYTVQYRDENGCPAEASILIEVNPYNKPLYVPNVFTPNGDGTNDVFLVYGLGIESVVLKVFNRWGEKMFESADMTVGWDGYHKGKMMNPGAYVYYTEVTYIDGAVKTRKGSVTLLRRTD